MAIDNHGKAGRSLPYPLYNGESEATPHTGGVVTNITPGFFPVDPDEKMNVIFNLSLNEFVSLASAIDVGRDIAFGEQSPEVWLIWIKALIGAGGTVSCQDVADCIETNTETQDAIATAVTINQLVQQAVIDQLGGLGNTNHVNADRTTVNDRNLPGSLQENIKELEDCNLDALWAGIREMVQRLDDTSRDWLEDLAIINDTAQRYQAFVSIIPIVGDVVEAVATAATEVIPDILNAYNSHSSEAVMDEIACDLFAMVCAECRYPTFEEVYTYYATLGFDVTNMDAQTTVNMVAKLATMMAGVPVPSVVYHTVVLFNLFTLYVQATYNGVSGTSTLQRWCALGEDFANNNWLELCDSCNETYRIMVWDFTKSEAGSYADKADQADDDGIYVPGKGWLASVFSTGQRVEFCIPFDANWRVRGYGIKESTTSGVSGRNVQFRPNAQTLVGAANSSPNNATGGEYTSCKNGILGITGYTEFAVNIQYGSQSPARYIEKLAIVFDAAYAPAAAQPTNDADLCA